MCGIAGTIGVTTPRGRQAAGRMQSLLRRRGPDATGIWQRERIVLAHTRLSIIDIDGSPQPMANATESVVVSYNGEIYNYAELRRRLIQAGHHFRTNGDTEVLLHLYEDARTDMLTKLDGMFAFALYDAQRHSLLLARDRIGIKPLYYWHDEGTGELSFASDMTAMLAHPAIDKVLNPLALAEYFQFGYACHPHSFIKDIQQLEPGECLTWQSGKISKTRYYQWHYAPEDALNDHGRAVDALQENVSQSIASHLTADVNVGSFLSGGLDSSTVTALAHRHRQSTKCKIDSFTVKFWQTRFDESERARNIARDLGTEHTEIDAQALTFDRSFIDSYVACLGEPFADSSALAMWTLCQQVRPHVKVALSGDGGDELFLGYSGLHKQRLARRLQTIPLPVRRMIAGITQDRDTTILRRLHKYTTLSMLDGPDILMAWAKRWRDADLRLLLGDDLAERVDSGREQMAAEIRSVIGAGATGGFAEQQIRFHMHVDLPCDCLFKVDRMSMAHGVEVRVPVLSNAMLSYAQRLPLSLRVHEGRTKEPLRTLAAKLSPVTAQPSPKRGFSFPLDSWMRPKLFSYWRDWELTAVLGRIGFSEQGVDRLIERYHNGNQQDGAYEREWLAAVLFDLLLLGVWVDNTGVRVA